MEAIFEPAGAGVPTNGDEAPTKKVRHRKKQFLKTIRKQMEFYFSDANLSKNRYLGQLVSKDPQVDLTVFLSFNKIRDITGEPDDIRKALEKSEMLSLTEDRTKVYRKTRVRQNENADESTIYVEQLPPDADHEWLKGVFLPYGDVPYVSIPKYPHNGLNKGFAFVEFDSPESATRALEAFGAMGCRLTADTLPEQLRSVQQAMRGTDPTEELTEEPGGSAEEGSKKHREEVKEEAEESKDQAEDGGKSSKKHRKEETEETVVGKSKDKEEGSGKGSKKRRKEIKEETEENKDEEEECGKSSKKRRKEMKEETVETGMEENKDQEEGSGKGFKKCKKEIKKETGEEEIKDQEEDSGKSSKKRRKEMKEETEETTEVEKNIDEEEDCEKGSKKRRKEIKEETQENKDEEVECGKSSKKRRREMKEEMEETGEEKNMDQEEDSVKGSKKRRREMKEETDKTGEENNDQEDDCGKSSKKHRKEIKEEVATEAEESDNKDDEKENEGNDEARKKKRSRNHKKKSKKDRPETEPKMSLRVLSKSEWKRLRNKYLGLQKVRMTQLKQRLHRSRWAGETQAVHHEDTRRQQEQGGEGEAEGGKTEKKFEFTPGVIVRLTFAEPPADVKQFKTDAKANPEVKYVDAKEGCNEAYVRCSTAEAANQMLAQQTWGQMHVLTGVEETAYWEKMDQDREVQCGRNTRVKVRGKAKLLAKVEKAVGKHIRFTAEEDGAPRGGQT